MAAPAIEPALGLLYDGWLAAQVALLAHAFVGAQSDPEPAPTPSAPTPEGLEIEVSNREGTESYRYSGQQRDGFTFDAALGDDGDTAAFCAADNIDGVRAYDLSKEAVIAWTVAGKLASQFEPTAGSALPVVFS